MEVLPNVTVRFKDQAILKVFNNIVLSATARLALEDNAQLLQKNPGTVPPPIDIVRLTNPISKRDYTYFCSPVGGQQLNLITDYGYNNGDLNFGYMNPNGYSNGLLTPNTYNTPLFDKYFTWNQYGSPVGYDTYLLSTGKWQNIPETSLMDPAGKGYIVRGPNSFHEISPKQRWQVKFTGIPNSGDIYTAIAGNSYTPYNGTITPYVPVVPFVPYEPCNNDLYTWNLIGNPYPSMLDADTFLTNPANVINLGGALYFWTHGSDFSYINPGNGTTALNYTEDDYDIYNLTGGIGGARRPNGKIATCQGFFTTGLANGSATFKEDMRDDSMNDPTQINNQVFFRNGSSSMISPLVKNRIWVTLNSASGAFKETLIGYIPAANTTNGAIAGSVNGFDKMYDTELLKTIYNTDSELSNRVELYTLINPTTPCPRLAIQGRTLGTTFNTSDVVTLGISCPGGTYTIKADTFDGMFSSQLFWLKETLAGISTYYDIRTTGYTFNVTTALKDNVSRFQIVFQLPALTNINPTYCNLTIASQWTTIYTEQVSGATQYHYLVERVSPTDSRQCDRTVSNFQFGNLAGASTPGAQYDIRVATYKIGTVWQYGSPCRETLTASYTRHASPDFSIFEAKIYPNPFTSNFNLDINTSSNELVEIIIYDLLGRPIETRKVNPSDLETQEIGSNYASGIYNLILKQGEIIKTLRILKR